MKRGSSVRLIGLPRGLVGASSTSVMVVSPAYAPTGAAAPSRMVAAAARIAATMFW